MTPEELLASWKENDAALDRKLNEFEEREIRYYAKFRVVFRCWPDVVAWLDEPVPYEERIRQRREERMARRRERDEELMRLFPAAAPGSRAGGVPPEARRADDPV